MAAALGHRNCSVWASKQQRVIQRDSQRRILFSAVQPCVLSGSILGCASPISSRALYDLSACHEIEYWVSYNWPRAASGDEGWIDSFSSNRNMACKIWGYRCHICRIGKPFVHKCERSTSWDCTKGFKVHVGLFYSTMESLYIGFWAIINHDEKN